MAAPEQLMLQTVSGLQKEGERGFAFGGGQQKRVLGLRTLLYVRELQKNPYRKHRLSGTPNCFRRRHRGGATGGAAGASREEEEEGPLCDAEVGDELVFTRRGVDRELFMWLVKQTRG